MTEEEERGATVVGLRATTEKQELTIDSEVTTEVRATEEKLMVTVVDSEAITEEEELTVPVVDSMMTTEEEELMVTVVDSEATTEEEELTIDTEVTTEARATEGELTVTVVDSEATTEEEELSERVREREREHTVFPCTGYPIRYYILFSSSWRNSHRQEDWKQL